MLPATYLCISIAVNGLFNAFMNVRCLFLITIKEKSVHYDLSCFVLWILRDITTSGNLLYAHFKFLCHTNYIPLN